MSSPMADRDSGAIARALRHAQEFLDVLYPDCECWEVENSFDIAGNIVNIKSVALCEEHSKGIDAPIVEVEA